MRCRVLSPLVACAALALFGAGCTTAPVATRPKAQEARLQIVNLTPYTWRVVLRTPTKAARDLQVAKFGSVEVGLEPGDCVIEQTLLDRAAVEPTRRFAARFEPDEAYTWSLATLLAATRAPETAESP